MVRSILVGVSAVFLSWLLLSVFTLAWLSWTRSGQLSRDQQAQKQGYRAVQNKYGDPFQVLNRGGKDYDIVILPLITVVIGVFVGATTGRLVGWTAALAIFPLQVFMVVADGFGLWAFTRALAYLLLAYVTAVITRSAKRRNSSPT